MAEQGAVNSLVASSSLAIPVCPYTPTGREGGLRIHTVQVRFLLWAPGELVKRYNGCFASTYQEFDSPILHFTNCPLHQRIRPFWCYDEEVFKILSMKRKIVNVEPVSNKAKNRFANMMDNLHGCYVEQENDTQLFLASINKKYFFWMSKLDDQNWKIVK